jgi:hypothetical protein
MKKLIIFLSFLAVAVGFSSCESDLEKVMLKSTVEPLEMTALTASSFTLLMDNAANTFQTFKWTEADYGFQANISYTVQIDKKSNNFSAPYDVVSISNLGEVAVIVGDFNKAMLNKGFETGVAADVQFRIKSMVNPNVAPVYSNVQEASVTPYAIIFPPIYMTGEATGGWNWNQYVYKELRSPSANVYETIGYFLNGKAFRFFKQADWGPVSYNYPYFTSVSTLFVNAGDGDSNFKVDGPTGYYKVTVNLTTKTVTTEAVADQVMYMTGAAVGGWDWTTNYVTMTWMSNGIYQATTDFIANEAFRFFAQAGWSPTSYNYPYFTGGTITPLLVNAADGDSNFRFVGTTGNFKITLNMLDKIITMDAAKK